MLISEFRQMTEEERQVLELCSKREYPPFFINWFFVLVVFPLIGFLLFGSILGRILELKGFSPDVYRWSLPIGTLLGLVTGIFLRFRRKKSKYQVSCQKDLQENTVEIIHCTVNGSIKLEESEDEGPGFFLDVGDSKILFLQGQYLYEEEESGRFPNQKFDIIKAPESGVILNVCCYAQAVPPRRVLPTNEVPYIPEDGEIFIGSLNSLETDLRKLKTSKSR